MIDRESSKPLSTVLINVYKSDETTLIDYTTSDNRGEYILEVSSKNNLIVTFSLLGYQSESIKIGDDTRDRNDIYLNKESINIKEVKIKPPRISSSKDTIRYHVDQFAHERSRSIGDVLKNMPGIEVTPSGGVIYNGKSINRFYIEGMNLLDNKYGIAVKNIDFKDVNQVEILENHQPVKVLEETIGTDRAALNLKLKEGSKNKWVGNLNAGVGITPILWDVSATALEVSTKWQSINVLKTNNIGQNITQELESQNIEDIINGMENNVNISNPFQMQFSPPLSLDESRYLFNQSLLANTRSIWNLRNDFTAKAGLSFTKDRLKNEVQSQQSYFTVDSTFSFVEFSTFTETASAVETTFNLNKNIKQFFLDNTFETNVYWDDKDVQTGGTINNLQSGGSRQYTLQNNFKFLKLIKKRRLSLNSFLRYDHQNVNGFVYYDNSSILNQSYRTESFFQHTNLSGSFSFKGWAVDNRLGWKESFKNISSRLTDSTNYLVVNSYFQKNDTRITERIFYYKPQISYKKSSVNFTMTLPLVYSMPTLEDLNKGKQRSSSSFFFNPSLNLNVNISPFFKFSLRGSIENSINLDELRYLPQTAMRNYRLFTLGVDSLERRARNSFGADINYRNPVKSTFAGLHFTKTYNRNGLIADNNFDGPIILQNLIFNSNTSSMSRISGQFGKGIDSWNATASLRLNYTSSSAEIMQNQMMLIHQIKGFELAPKFSAAPYSWLNIDYEANLYVNQSTIEGSSSANLLNQRKHKLKATYVISEKISSLIGWDYLFNEISDNTSLTQQFLDLSLGYNLNNRISFTASGTNILNERNFGYTEFLTNSINSSYYFIRPANFIFSMHYKF